jgi:hypothetical protein
MDGRRWTRMFDRSLSFGDILLLLARFGPKELLLLNREDAKDTKEEGRRKKKKADLERTFDFDGRLVCEA